VNRRRTAVLALSLLLAGAPGCSSQNPTIDPNDPGPTVTIPEPGSRGGPKVTGKVTVYGGPELEAVATRLVQTFAAQNPDADITFTGEAPRESMLRFIAGADADVFIADQRSLLLLRAYLNGLPRTEPFARDALILAIPEGNPKFIRRLEDVGELPSEAVCTPPYMLQGSVLPLDEVTVPLNPEAAADCGTTAVDALAAGDLDAALVPGSAVGFIRGRVAERIRLPAPGNLLVPYGMVLLSDNEAAKGFTNFVSSVVGGNIISESGYG
jgi:ABC-type molybdate transport system substrate-binding protein